MLGGAASFEKAYIATEPSFSSTRRARLLKWPLTTRLCVEPQPAKIIVVGRTARSDRNSLTGPATLQPQARHAAKTHVRASSGLADVAKPGEGFTSADPRKTRPGALFATVFVVGCPQGVFFRWPGDHNLVTGSRDDAGMRKVSQEDLGFGAR
jgi:hypothetical protein